MKNKSQIFAFLAAAATIFIFYNSSRTAAESSAASSFFSDMVMKRFSFANADSVIFFVRKTAHATEFFAQSFLICAAYFFGKSKLSEKIANVLFFGLLTACSDELLQHFVEGRADMVTDIWIDFAGTVAALAVSVALSAVFEKRRKKR